MNNQQLFDIVGLVTTVFALPFQYFITYFFLEKLLGFKYKVSVFILVVAIVTAITGYIFMFKMPLPVYVQILIENLLLLIMIYSLCKGSFLAKLYAYITQAAVIMLTAIAFISVDYKILFALLNQLNMDKASDVALLFIVDVARDGMNLLIPYIFFKNITNCVSFRENALKWYQGIYLLVPNFAIHGMAVLFYIVQEIKINDNDYYLFTIFPNMYYVVPIISAALLVSLLLTAFTFRKMLEGEEMQQNHLLMQQQFKQQINHGIGISNIIATVKKYEGVVDIIESKNKFTLNLMLKVK